MHRLMLRNTWLTILGIIRVISGTGISIRSTWKVFWSCVHGIVVKATLFSPVDSVFLLPFRNKEHKQIIRTRLITSISLNNQQQSPVLPDIAGETSKQAYEKKPKTSDFSVRVKKKKRRDYYTLHSHKYQHESRYIIVFIIDFICFDPFLF